MTGIGDEGRAFMSLEEQAAQIRRREISPVELIRLYLDRIAASHDDLHAYITVCGDRALDDAKAAEREIAAGRYRGPLHGIPYGVKDQMCVAGLPTTLGSRAVSKEPATFDATAVARMRAAGAILIGTHNLREMGKGVTNDFPYGQPRNPWNAAHTASSSSTGSGIAVAAGLCTVALGEDTGSSIRGPASACGIVGLRPTYGRVSRHGGIMYAYTNDTIGPMARRVRDCALVLQAIAGHDASDPLSSTRPVLDYTAHLDGDLRGLRLAVPGEMVRAEGTHPDVTAAFDAALDVLRSLGATVSEISLPWARFAVPLQMLTADVDVAGVFLPKWLRTHWHDLDSSTRTRFAAASLIPAAVYGQAMRARALVRRQILNAFGSYDAFVCPTNPTPPARIEDARETADDIDELNRRITHRRISSYPFSLANLPTIAVPCGISCAGLPLSMQVAARPFAEDAVFRIADAYEQVTEWHSYHPRLESLAA